MKLHEHIEATLQPLIRGDGTDETWLRMETDATDCPREVESALEFLWEEWRDPAAPQYVFVP